MERFAAICGDSVAIAFRRRLAWPHPEWWSLTLSGAAWLSIASKAIFTVASVGAHHASASHEIDLMTATRDWMLMTVAMMVPLSIGAIRATADRSLWRRRHRAIAGWLAGYFSVWLVAGVALWFVMTLFEPSMLTSRSVAAIAFLLAAAWQIAPARARAFARCHHTQPLAPTGWRADYDCLRYGSSTGWSCAMTCGVLMVACALLGHGVPGVLAMAGITVIGLAERYLPRPDPWWLAAPIATMGVLVLATRW